MTAVRTIRDVARATGVGAHTLRYYERIGLIPEVARAGNGHRRYAAEDVVWIEFLKRLRATGMPIAEMGAFAALRKQGAPSVPERKRMLVAHRQRVEAQLETLRDHLAAIEAKIALLEGRAEPAPPSASRRR